MRNKWAFGLGACALMAIILWGVLEMANKQESAMIDENTEYTGHGGTFKNPLAEIDTPDPSIVYKDGYYYMTFTHNGADIMVMKSRTLDFRHAVRKVVWYPPVGTAYSANLWAPEIQYLQGKWYIYFAADDGNNENHRMYVLEADTDDPLGSYTFKGQVTDETNKWAIDGIVLEHEGQLYFVWSGWEGDVNYSQNTYIAPMSDPLTISGPRVELSRPELDWEKMGGPPYIQEGHAILQRDGNVYLIYSGAGSWTPYYSLGMLYLEAGKDPLIAENWHKSDKPLLRMNEEAGVYGPGHNTFAWSPDGREQWIIYHATSGIHDGWNNRKARAQKMSWDEAGMPVFAEPVSLDTPLEVPSGSGVFSARHAVRNGESLEFADIPSTVETDAPLLVHYRNDSGQERQAALRVNGEPAGEISLPPTKPGETGYAYTLVPLAKGQNTIALDDTAQAVAWEAIELPRYEAEVGHIGQTGDAVDNPFGSGGGIVRVSEGKGAAVTFGNIRVPEAGTYTLRLALSNPSDSAATVTVKTGGQSKKVTADPGERNHFEIKVLSMKLTSGKNEITVQDSSGRIDIDYLDIIR